MAINTSTFESTLQNKLDNVTDPKEMLLLGKALESTVGSIAVSDIETAGAAQVANINSVATNTFKTVGGTSILGTGDIATLPSQTGNAGKVLTTDGTNASWGNGSKILQVKQVSYSQRTGLNNVGSRQAWWNPMTFPKLQANSILRVSINIPLGGSGASYPHFGEAFIRFSTGGYDQNGSDIHGYIHNTRATTNNMGAMYTADFLYDTTGTNISAAGNVYITIGHQSSNGDSLHPAPIWNPNQNEDGRSWQTVSTVVVEEISNA